MTDTERKTPTDSAMTAEQIDDSYIPSIVSRLRGPQDQYGTPASSTDLAIATLIERLTTERTKLAADLARVTEDRDRLVKKYDYVVSVAAGMEQRAIAAAFAKERADNLTLAALREIATLRAQVQAGREAALEDAARLVTRYYGRDIETYDLPNQIRALTEPQHGNG